MKRVAIGLLMLCSAVALAQAPFTIVRPQDGARVREVVQIRFPIRSVPQGGFIGVTINGKFVEAVAPAALETDRERGHYIYRWDTKKLNVPDGEHTIELTLYQSPEGGSARILARSAVRVQVENEIKVPAEGIPLRYRWVPGRTYRYQVKGTVKEINEVQYSGLAPEETLIYDVSFRGELNVMDFRNNLGLISWTPMPPAIAITGSGQVETITSDRMIPVYQEVETTGRVLYQVSRGADAVQQDVFYVWTADLPLLPPRRYKPGDRWGATITLSNPLESGDPNEIGLKIPVAAHLERFEWEQGYKCAKIVYEFTGNLPRSINLGGVELDKPKSTIRRVVYFAYDIGQVIRVTTTLQLEGIARQEQFGGGFGTPSAPGAPAPPGFGGRGGVGADDEGGMRGPRGMRGPGIGGVGIPGAPGGGGAPRGGFRGGGVQTGARNIINRFVREVDMRLIGIF